MKRTICFLSACTLYFAISCSKPAKTDGPGEPGGPGNPGNPNPPAQEQPAGEGVKADAGTPDGTPKAEKIIGAAGGNLTSNDGKVKVTIPAGALSANQTIGIQRISNTNPLGTEHAYRITPHGQRFTKPVELAFQYDNALLDGTPPHGMGIAYQDDKGMWVALPAEVNTTAKTITVATTHFSDWDVFRGMSIAATMKKVPASLTTLIMVFDDNNLLAPLVPKNGRYIPKDKNLADDEYLVGWTKNGAGTLNGAGSQAYYTAPNEALGPPQNPATITAEYRPPSGGVYMLAIEITTEKGFLDIRINDGAWIKLEPVNATLIDGLWSVSTHQVPNSQKGITFFWRGGKGSHNFDLTSNIVLAHDGVTGYASSYTPPNGNEVIPSPGAITITDLGEKDFFVDGTFVAYKAGVQSDNSKTVKLEGRFRVVKRW
ncbi:hypothetical protein [Chitinophaga caseinilytica]|uniref:ZU5 domain-containing protein n=1 Tax=Chitinophaga caseinilytica TaxID=2267521 RepID=A0ABZ2Z153_9BACT